MIALRFGSEFKALSPRPADTAVNVLDIARAHGEGVQWEIDKHNCITQVTLTNHQGIDADRCLLAALAGLGVRCRIKGPIANQPDPALQSLLGQVARPPVDRRRQA
ncbi:MAG: hypothetical protein IPK79_08225 [Vampirovibrionales bacterium]|nr:hypothetical protein [Vampirovibrionales bacterium]